MRPEKFLGGFLIFMSALGAKALPLDSNQVIAADQIDLAPQIEALEKKLLKSRGDLEAKIKLFHTLSNAGAGPSFIWLDENATAEKRKALTQMTQVSLRLKLREIEGLETQISALRSEMEWNKLNAEALKHSSTGDAKTPDFKCFRMPVTSASGSRLKLLQDFGTKKDTETGLQWSSTGWWIANIGGEVASCAPGKVVFSEKVSGRGRVLILDHGSGALTIYANLSESPDSAPLSVGTRVRTGTVLGQASDRFYFEVRLGGYAVNPRKVLASNRLFQLDI